MLRTLLAILILLSAIPDTMAAPVVKELIVDRYGSTAREAQAFNGIHLLGALAAVPLLAWFRRRGSVQRRIAWASAADAILLGAMILPLGLGWTLMLRALEGVTDVLVFAGLFDLVRRSGSAHVAMRLGIASTPLLFGLGAGALIGGAVVRAVPASSAPAIVFGGSAIACLLVTMLVRFTRATANEAGPPEACGAAPLSSSGAAAGPLWPALAMSFSDRAAGGVLTGTLPVALSTVLGYSPALRGAIIGIPLALMALGCGPAGWLCDRWGGLRVRLLAGIVYALGLLAIAPSSGNAPLLGVVMVALGVAGSALFASSLALIVRPGDSTVQLGAFRGAGDVGFLAGTGFSLLLLGALGGENPTLADYGSLIALFAGFHALTTIVSGTALVLGSRAPRA